MSTDIPFRLHGMHSIPPTSICVNCIPSDLVQYRTEPDLRLALVRRLAASGISLDANVWCAAGSADLVTPLRDIIIEVKYRLTRSALFEAIGRVLMYRQFINPAARALVVGYPTIETNALIPHAATLEVEIVCWRDGGKESVTAIVTTFPYEGTVPIKEWDRDERLGSSDSGEESTAL